MVNGIALYAIVIFLTLAGLMDFLEWLAYELDNTDEDDIEIGFEEDDTPEDVLSEV